MSPQRASVHEEAGSTSISMSVASDVISLSSCCASVHEPPHLFIVVQKKRFSLDHMLPFIKLVRTSQHLIIVLFLVWVHDTSIQLNSFISSLCLSRSSNLSGGTIIAKLKLFARVKGLLEPSGTARGPGAVLTATAWTLDFTRAAQLRYHQVAVLHSKTTSL